VELIIPATFSYFARHATRRRATRSSERPAQSRRRAQLLREGLAQSGKRLARFEENEDKKREDLPAMDSIPSPKLLNPGEVSSYPQA
jgi:hypothetical protein